MNNCLTNAVVLDYKVYLIPYGHIQAIGQENTVNRTAYCTDQAIMKPRLSR